LDIALDMEIHNDIVADDVQIAQSCLAGWFPAYRPKKLKKLKKNILKVHNLHYFFLL